MFWCIRAKETLSWWLSCLMYQVSLSEGLNFCTYLYRVQEVAALKRDTSISFKLLNSLSCFLTCKLPFLPINLLTYQLTCCCYLFSCSPLFFPFILMGFFPAVLSILIVIRFFLFWPSTLFVAIFWLKHFPLSFSLSLFVFWFFSFISFLPLS